MFTRYSEVNIPENYSGNRFRGITAEDTSTKVHKNEVYEASTSSVSPTFNTHINMQNSHAEHNDIELKSLEIEDNRAQDDSEAMVSLQNDNTEKRNIFQELTPFSKYLSKINGEDLLLIALIIFLSSDKNRSNNDVIILLALLLVYHS